MNMLYSNKRKKIRQVFIQNNFDTLQEEKVNSKLVRVEEELASLKHTSKQQGIKISLKKHKELEEYKLDIEGLRKLLELKTNELKKIKVQPYWPLLTLQKLARLILDQRTELEQFFLDSLEEVKLEMQRQKEGDQSAPVKKVDIKDLSWAEKEKILRLLFYKMNHPNKGPAS
jgi:hypothetical protein